MADINAIQERLNKLKSTQSRKDLSWNPPLGKTQIRIIPYKFDQDMPFTELYFHYGIKNRTYLSPISFGRPDPFAEFAQKLRRSNDEDDYKQALKFSPKLRTYVPIVLREDVNKGLAAVKFWGFGKTVYESILNFMAEPGYGDITDPSNGRDIIITRVPKEQTGTSYDKITVLPAPTGSPITTDVKLLENLITNQTKLEDLWDELPYDELNKVLEEYLNPDAPEVQNESNSSNLPWENNVVGSQQPATPEKVEDAQSVVDQFDALFEKNK